MKQEKICLYCDKKFFRKDNQLDCLWIKQKYCNSKCKSNKNSLNYYYNHKKRVLRYQIKRLEILKKTNIELRQKYNIRKIAQKNICLRNKKCEICNSIENLNRHHPDYNNPNKIIILCKKCHNNLHKKNLEE